MTGVEVPKYYNPAAVNPLKYAEQVQKRKLLWSKKTEEKNKNVSTVIMLSVLFGDLAQNVPSRCCVSESWFLEKLSEKFLRNNSFP